jgi:hypothetical protein
MHVQPLPPPPEPKPHHTWASMSAALDALKMAPSRRAVVLPPRPLKPCVRAQEQAWTVAAVPLMTPTAGSCVGAQTGGAAHPLALTVRRTLDPPPPLLLPLACWGSAQAGRQAGRQPHLGPLKDLRAGQVVLPRLGPLAQRVVAVAPAVDDEGVGRLAALGRQLQRLVVIRQRLPPLRQALMRQRAPCGATVAGAWHRTAI